MNRTESHDAVPIAFTKGVDISENYKRLCGWSAHTVMLVLNWTCRSIKTSRALYGYMALLGFSILVYKTHIFIPTYTFSELKCQSLEYGRVHFFVFLQVRTHSISTHSVKYVIQWNTITKTRTNRVKSYFLNYKAGMIIINRVTDLSPLKFICIMYTIQTWQL